MVVAEAQFSKTKQDENIFYVGAFGRWFNINARIMQTVLDLDKKFVSARAQSLISNELASIIASHSSHDDPYSVFPLCLSSLQRELGGPVPNRARS